MRRWRLVSLYVGLVSILSGQIQPALNRSTQSNRSTTAEGIPLPLSVKAIAASHGRSLALASDGTVWEWGAGCRLPGFEYSPAPAVLELSRPAPSRVSGLNGVVSVASGYDLNLAAKGDGTVWAWGGYESCGRTTAWAMPFQVSGISDAVAVAAGSSYDSVALKRDGTVWFWRWNHTSYGTSTGSIITAEPTTPVQVSGLAGVVRIALGAGYGVALKSDGTAWTWSQTSSGQPFAMQVNGLSGVAAIAAAGFQIQALRGDGTVWSWSSYSATGTPIQPIPAPVSGLSGVIAIAAGDYGRGCGLAVRNDGTVWAWGDNHSGQLGDGTTTDRSTPLQVGGLSGVVAVATGGSHSLALKADGTLSAWGANYYGQLGDGTPQPAPIAPVRGLGGVVAVAAGHYYSLALRADGSVWQWGVGRSIWPPEYRATPAQVSGLPEVVKIAAGFGQNLALASDGTVWEWGFRSWPEPPWDRPVPIQVSGLAGVVAIAAGGVHSMALKEDGTVWAWGDNQYGQLGDGTTTKQATPVQVSGLSGVVAVAAGGVHSVALKGDGTVWQWGDTDHKNQYCTWGYETATPQLTPVQVSGLSGVVAISAARVMAEGATYCDHTLALKSDGTALGWGINLSGELGDGTARDRSTTAPVRDLEKVVSVAAGGGLNSLAVKADGTVWAWGANYVAQLGDGTTEGRLTPVRVGGVAGAVAVAGAAEHSLVLMHDGTVWAWGTNGWGQLGYENATNQMTPVQVVTPGSPDLTLVASHAGDFSVGSPGVYALTVTNVGLAPTDGTITVTATLPQGLTFFSATGTDWTCATAGHEVTCSSAGPVNPEASSAITMTVDVGPDACPGVMTRADVSNQSDRNISNNTAWDPTVVLRPPPGSD
jgi:uncharacterized repeat protein (TIGR01451 family)